jgi:hypothetical protein
VLLVVAAVAAAAVFVGNLAITPVSSLGPGSAAASVDAELQRSRDASAARWEGLGEWYAKWAAASVEADMQRSRDASAARWQALGEFYAKRAASPAGMGDLRRVEAQQSQTKATGMGELRRFEAQEASPKRTGIGDLRRFEGTQSPE